MLRQTFRQLIYLHTYIKHTKHYSISTILKKRKKPEKFGLIAIKEEEEEEEN